MVSFAEIYKQIYFTDFNSQKISNVFNILAQSI